MSPRVGHRNRCTTCGMRNVLCLCHEFEKIELKTHVSFVMHFLEAKTTTNTARLACVALKNSEIHLRGLPGSRPDETNIILPGFHSVVLFPYEDAHELSPEFINTLNQPIQLIVPDGTWRQASKAAKRVPELKHLMRVKLPPGGALSEYKLRKESRDENVCTYEATARAIGLIESKEAQMKMEHLFRMMVDRTLWSQGKKPPQEVYGGIPDAAIQESWN